ncbi:MAG: hypothetical protein E6G56_15810 [Actinobacteria bacterium]|nr:MAG: hypothetical protein E6G56_15810 [Actinomycetota bacterium]
MELGHPLCHRCGRPRPSELDASELGRAGWSVGPPPEFRLTCPGCLTAADFNLDAVQFAREVLQSVARRASEGKPIDAELARLVDKAIEFTGTTVSSMRGTSDSIRSGQWNP